MTGGVSGRHDVHLMGSAMLTFISTHRTWWTTLQTLVLGSGLLAVVVFVAVFVALLPADESKAAVAAIVAVASQLLLVACAPCCSVHAAPCAWTGREANYPLIVAVGLATPR